MWLKKQVPNIITLFNLFSGSIAVIFAVRGDLELTAIFVMLGIFFDFFDGFAARMLNAQSELGLQLDSLADMVTSGVAPGIVMFQLLQRSIADQHWVTTTQSSLSEVICLPNGIALIGLFIILASAYRLAKFNVDTRQTTSFIGLPTPANALLIVSLPLILTAATSDWVVGIILNKWFLIVLTVLSCYLLNAEIPLFSLKFKTWDFANNKVRYIFILLAIILIGFLKFLAIPFVILAYVLFSLIFSKQIQ